MRLLLSKGNQITQFQGCSAFLPTGRCRSLGPLKSPLSHAPQLSGARVRSSRVLPAGSPPCSPAAARLQVLLSFLSALRTQKFTFGGPGL